MNRSFTHFLPAKVIALFLAVILGFCMIFCGIVELMVLGYGMYSQRIYSYYETSQCYSEMVNDLHQVQNELMQKEPDLGGYYGDLENCSFRFAGYDPDTGRFFSNDQALEETLRQMVEVGELVQVEIAGQGNNAGLSLPECSADGYALYSLMEKEINGDIFLAGVVEHPFAMDSYYRDKQMFDLANDFRVIAPAVLVAAAFALLADVIFLCCASGRRYGMDGIHPNLQDRIPLDFYLCGMTLLIAGCVALAMEQTYSYWNLDQLILVCLCLTAAGILCLATLLTLATRFKAGKWWRNTIVYACWQLCLRLGRKIRSAWYDIRLTWRVALAAGTLLFVLPMLFSGGVIYVAVAAALVLLACSTARQMAQLKQAGKALAEGDFEQNVDTTALYGELREHGKHLNSLGRGLSIAVDQRMRSERMKTELITNVSHDIKTPLTSIINYVDLLQKDPTPEERDEYLAVLDRQAKRLKKLTEDLVEASKASTGNLSCTLAPTNLREILDQALGEYEERLSSAGLEPVLTLPEGEVTVLADGRLLWRVLDNLLNNACKYAQSGTRLYLDGKLTEETVVLSLKNISRQQLNLSPDELMERFVRGDSSRNTEGSGLGLNIAKSLVELQKGSFDLAIDGDLFKATVTLPLCLYTPAIELNL